MVQNAFIMYLLVHKAFTESGLGKGGDDPEIWQVSIREA